MSMVLIQVSVVLSIAFGVYELECKGSFLNVIAMSFFTGFSGMCYGNNWKIHQEYSHQNMCIFYIFLFFQGFVISTWCPSHTMANFLSTGSFYPLVLLGGKHNFFLFELISTWYQKNMCWNFLNYFYRLNLASRRYAKVPQMDKLYSANDGPRFRAN